MKNNINVNEILITLVMSGRSHKIEKIVRSSDKSKEGRERASGIGATWSIMVYQYNSLRYT